MALVTTSLAALAAGLAGSGALVSARAAAREARWRAAFPPLGRFVEVDGKRVHLVEHGPADAQARPLVLIHGANGNLRDYAFDLIARLAPRYRVIALDRPGLGWSDGLGPADADPGVQARHLRAALAQLGLARAPIVLGHSYGGAVAMAWAVQAPDETAGVVLLAGATYPWEGVGLGLWYGLNDTPAGRPARALVTALAPEPVILNALAGVFAPAPLPEGYAAYFGAGLALRRATQAANTRQVNALSQALRRQQPRYGALRLPIEIVHGDADTIVWMTHHSRSMIAEVASARLSVLEGAGHMPHHSHPEAVIAAINRVAARAEAG